MNTASFYFWLWGVRQHKLHQIEKQRPHLSSLAICRYLCLHIWSWNWLQVLLWFSLPLCSFRFSPFLPLIFNFSAASQIYAYVLMLLTQGICFKTGNVFFFFFILQLLNISCTPWGATWWSGIWVGSFLSRSTWISPSECLHIEILCNKGLNNMLQHVNWTFQTNYKFWFNNM